MQLFADLYDAIVAFPKPTIAACHGDVVGGGAEIAIACDMRVGGANLRMRFPGAALGVPVGPARLVTLCGLAAAKYLLLTSRTVGADEALRLGLVNRVAPAAATEEAALELAADGRRPPARGGRPPEADAARVGRRRGPLAAPRAWARSSGPARARVCRSPTRHAGAGRRAIRVGAPLNFFSKISVAAVRGAPPQKKYKTFRPYRDRLASVRARLLEAVQLVAIEGRGPVLRRTMARRPRRSVPPRGWSRRAGRGAPRGCFSPSQSSSGRWRTIVVKPPSRASRSISLLQVGEEGVGVERVGRAGHLLAHRAERRQHAGRVDVAPLEGEQGDAVLDARARARGRAVAQAGLAQDLEPAGAELAAGRAHAGELDPMQPPASREGRRGRGPGSPPARRPRARPTARGARRGRRPRGRPPRSPAAPRGRARRSAPRRRRSPRPRARRASSRIGSTRVAVGVLADARASGARAPSSISAASPRLSKLRQRAPRAPPGHSTRLSPPAAPRSSARARAWPARAPSGSGGGPRRAGSGS